MRSAPLVAALAVLTASLAVGCGPIRSTVGIVQADRALAEARAAGAEQRAAYPYGLGEGLLERARREQGYSRWYESEQLAVEALGYATEARDLSGDDDDSAGGDDDDSAGGDDDDSATTNPPAAEEPETAPSDPEPVPAASVAP